MDSTLPEPPALEIENLTVAYRQGKLWLDAVRVVSLRIEPGQALGLAGESGSGKSTLALAAMRYLPENGAVRQGAIRLAGRDLLALSAAEMQQAWREQIKLVPQNPQSSLNPSMRIGDQLAEAFSSIAVSGATPHRRNTSLPAKPGSPRVAASENAPPSLRAKLRSTPQPKGRSGRSNLSEGVLEALAAVQISDPQRVAHSYPHQLSGGMQQRVLIAMALAAEPLLLVLDEPTTNLDVTTEAVILDLIRELIRGRATSVLYVSHNLAVLSSICDRVAVLYAGELVENAPVAELYNRPLHPYTRGLLDSVPRPGVNRRQAALLPIPGSIPRLGQQPPGCVFAPRCPVAPAIAAEERPSLSLAAPGHWVRCHRWEEILAGEVDVEGALAQLDLMKTPDATTEQPAETVLEVTDLEKRFVQPRSLGEALRRQPAREVRAVNGVDAQIRRGRTLGLVGESGGGKTTMASCIVGLAERDGGDVTLLQVPLAPALGDRDRAALRRLQMVFQNPDEALNPYRTVGQTLARTLTRLAGLPEDAAQRRAGELLAAVKLDSSYLERLPGQLSGGEKQRVAVARAFASQPDLLIFDESVSALDVSVQAAILNLLSELQVERQTSYLFISHDLSVVAYLADDVAVMYLGQIVEIGPAEGVFAPPHHPYTEALISAIPRLGPSARRERIHLVGEVPSPAEIPSGCSFHTRCPRFLGDICVQQAPPWQLDAAGHLILCHIPPDELRRLQGEQNDGAGRET